MKLLILIVVFVFTNSLVRCTNFVESKEKELSVIEMPNTDYRLRIIYYPSNATIESSIQVRKTYKNGKKEELLKDLKRYNYVDTFYLQKNDSMLLIVVKDTISYLGNKPDTILVNVK